MRVWITQQHVEVEIVDELYRVRVSWVCGEIDTDCIKSPSRKRLIWVILKKKANDKKIILIYIL